MKDKIAGVLVMLLLLVCVDSCGDDAEQSPWELGVAALESRNFEEAVMQFTAQMKIDPENFAAYMHRSLAYTFLNDLDAAVRDIDTALKFADADHEKLTVLINKGMIHSQKKEHNNSIAAYNKAIEINPNVPHCYSMRGTAYYHQRNFKKAAADFSKHLEIDPNDDFTLLWGHAATMKTGNEMGLSSKLSAYYEGLDAAKRSQWPIPITAMFLEKITPEECLRAADDGNETTRKNQLTEAHFFIGEYHLAEGNRPKAEEHFEECVELNVTDYREFSAAQIELSALK